MGLPSSVTVDLCVERCQEALSETGTGQLCCFRACILLLASSWLFNHSECSTFLRVNNTQKGVVGWWFQRFDGGRASVSDGGHTPFVIKHSDPAPLQLLFTLMKH